MRHFHLWFLCAVFLCGVASPVAAEMFEDVYQAGDGLDRSLGSLQQGVFALEQANKQLQIYIAELPDQIHMLHQHVNQLQIQEKDILQRSLLLEESIVSHREKSKRMQEKVSSLTEQLKQRQQENEALAKQVEEKRKQENEMSRNLDTMRAAINDLNRKLDVLSDFESQSAKIQRDKLHQKKLLIQRKKELHEKYNKLEDVKDDQQGPVRMKRILEEERGKLKARLDELRKQEAQLTQERESVIVEQNEGKSVPVFFTWNERRMSRLEREVEALQRLEESLKEAYSEVEMQQAQRPVEGVNIEVEERKLQANIEDMTRKNKLLKSRLHALQLEMIELDKEKTRLERLSER